MQGGFADHVDALLVIGVCPIGIGGDAFVEGRDGVIDFAHVGQHRARIVVIPCSILWIHLCRLVVCFQGVIDLAGLAESLSQVVVIPRQPLDLVGILLGCGIQGLLLEIDRLLIVADCLLQALGLLRGIGLL